MFCYFSSSFSLCCSWYETYCKVLHSNQLAQCCKVESYFCVLASSPFLLPPHSYNFDWFSLHGQVATRLGSTRGALSSIPLQGFALPFSWIWFMVLQGQILFCIFSVGCSSIHRLQFVFFLFGFFIVVGYGFCYMDVPLFFIEVLKFLVCLVQLFSFVIF